MPAIPPSGMLLDETTALALGWDEIRKLLSGHTLTPQGAALALALVPSPDREEILRSQALLRQIETLLDLGFTPPLEGIEEVEEDLVRAEKHGTLPAEAILRVGRALVVSSRLRLYLMNEGSQHGEALCVLARGSTDLLPVGRELCDAFEPSGLLRDSASPELAERRQVARALADTIRNRLEHLVRGPKGANLMEPLITLRGDRYVLPVRSDARGGLPGIVHDTSQSGATLFIEPVEVVEDGNRLLLARAAVVQEEQRILASYTREIGELAGSLRANIRMLARFDQVYAAWKLGRQMKATLPEVGGVGFDLRAARHPLMALESAAVVPNDIRLPEKARGLVITGPNAGGKTVALKTLGLQVLMAQSGLAVPAQEGSRLGLFSSLHAVIGDEQDLRRGLSTFSAHVEHISRILDHAGPGTLVLLDELAADTEPRHGAALAQALLQALVQRGACLVVTTHFEELKALAVQNRAFANASAGFDVSRLEPTFVLHPDIPGRSLTLDIARRLGVPEEVLQVASGLLNAPEHQLDLLLSDLDQERQALSQVRLELRQKEALAEEARVRSEKTAAAAEQTRRELHERGKKQLLDELQTLRRQAAELIETLKKEPTMKKAVAASEQLIALEHGLREQERQEKEPAPLGRSPPESYQPDVGDRVLVVPLDKSGEVSSVDRRAGMVTIRLGSLQTRVAFEQVRPVASLRPGQGRTAPSAGLPRNLPAAEPLELRTSENTLDLRGLRADEAVEAVDRFLDRLFAAGTAAAFLIHGHGTGALKVAVRDYLRRSPYQRHFRTGTLEEGGDGITVVRLK